MFLVTTVVAMMLIVVLIKSIELKQKLDAYQEKERVLTEQIAEEEKRSEEIAEYEKYTHTKKYIEEVAKDKLGLIHEDEIIFRKKIKCRCGKAGICIFCRIKIIFHVPVLTNGQESVLYNVPLQESVQEQGMEGCAMKKQSISGDTSFDSILPEYGRKNC